ncbi:hypothetical protein D4R99_04740 [bacterium]|nr:MAG: hypothetical protein D4R99_04740 [bacterium]
MTKRYSINDLSLFSPWPARLLGIEEFSQKHKNRSEAIREFEEEKWGPLCRKIQEKSSATILDVSEIFNGHAGILYYDHGVFKKGDAFIVHKKYIKMACDTILSYINKKETIVEFGSGYGAIALSLAKKVRSKKIHIIAGEYTESGRSIIKTLAKKGNFDVVVGECDINSDSITEMAIPKNSVIYTSSTAYIIPFLPESFVKNILRFKPKIVIHIEPIYEHTNNGDLYSLLRKRYIEINEYNRNLLTLLKKAEEMGLIQIERNDPIIFGDNPLFCYSIIAWRPVKR